MKSLASIGRVAAPCGLFTAVLLMGCIENKPLGNGTGGGGQNEGGQNNGGDDAGGGNTGGAGTGGQNTGGNGGNMGGGDAGGGGAGGGNTGGAPSGITSTWAKQAGDPGLQRALDVDRDSAGNLIVGGEMLGSATFGGVALTSAGDRDAFLVKYDGNGDVVWAKSFGDAGIQLIDTVFVDANDDIYVAGDFNGSIDLGGGALVSAGDYDVFVAKLDGDGNEIWSKRFGDAVWQGTYPGPGRTSVAADAAGNVYLTGTFRGTMDFGPGGSLVSTDENKNVTGDIFLAKLDANGTPLWAKQLGDYDDLFGEAGEAVDVDGDGNVVLAGAFTGTIDLGAGPHTTGNQGGFLAKFSPSGALIWEKVFGEFGAFIGGLDVAPNGDVSLSGTYQFSIDFGGGALTTPNQAQFIAKLDSAGGHLYSHLYNPSTNAGLSPGVAIRADGSVAVVGGFSQSLNLGPVGGPTLTGFGISPQGYIAMFDPTGTFVSASQYGLPSAGTARVEFANAVFDGEYLDLAGSFEGPVDMGFGPMTAMGISYDTLVARLHP